MDLVSSRLILHPIAPPEARQIVDGSGRETGEWHPEYPLVDELDPLRMLADSLHEPTAFTLYQIRLRASGLAIGGIGFFGPPDVEGCAEIGYGIVEAERGHGFATEALRTMIEFAAGQGARSVKADTATDNQASQRVLSRAGFAEMRRSQALVYYRLELA